MIGAVIGDIVGSIYEFDNLKSKEFDFFAPECFVTDDSVMTFAVARTLREYDKTQGVEAFKKKLVAAMHSFGNRYPDAGYGGNFARWLYERQTKPYNSFGNGSAMRVSPVAWVAETLEEAESLAKASAEVTHNHPEGIKGAQAVAAAIFLARENYSVEQIKKYVESEYYRLDFTLDEIRPRYRFAEICQESVPQALEAFFEANGFEDAVRNAVSIGGDSDTIAAMTGSIAEAYYGVPEDIFSTALCYLDDYLLGEYAEWKQYLKDNDCF